MTEIPVDGNVERTWINMQGVNSIHEGLEVDLSYKPAKWFSLRGMLSVGNWRWTNNPVGYFYNSAGQPIDKFGHPLDQSQGPDHARMRFNQKDVKEGGSAQLTAGLGFNVYPMEGLRIGLDWKYFSNYYADYAVTANDISLDGVKTFQTPSRLISLAVTA